MLSGNVYPREMFRLDYGYSDGVFWLSFVSLFPSLSAASLPVRRQDNVMNWRDVTRSARAMTILQGNFDDRSLEVLVGHSLHV